MNQIRVLLAEDHTIVRKGLLALLEKETRIEVVGEAENGFEALSLASKTRPDIIMMDISMPEMNGIEATHRIKHEQPEIKIIMLTMHDNEEYILQGLKAGAESYLVKETAPQELIRAIELTYAGNSYISPLIPRRVIERYLNQTGDLDMPDRYDRLTKREREVLQLIAEGLSIKEIGDKLCISEKTARAHRLHLMEKLDLHDIASLTLYALRRGVISLAK